MVSLIRENGIFKIKRIPFNNIIFVFSGINNALLTIEEFNKK